MEPIHKLNIDNFLLRFEEDVKYIYGGITENSFEERRQEHIRHRQPLCDFTWIISERAITTINIKNENIDYYDKIKDTEQYLIDKLNEKFGNKCKNDRNNDGNIAQRGGAGVQNQNLELNDAIKFYIFYKLN
jgi:hypothetical protein